MSEAAEPQLRSAAEAILIVADEPVTTSAIAEALGIEESVCPGWKVGPNRCERSCRPLRSTA